MPITPHSGKLSLWLLWGDPPTMSFIAPSWHFSVTPASGAVATGTVTFKNGTATLGTGTLNSSGVATVSTTGLSVGTHSIDAVYNGSTDDLTSTSASLSQVVNQ